MADDMPRLNSPLPELISTRLDDEKCVAGDLACTTCGYNLRTLSAEGRCPECGTDVRQSIRLTAEATRKWIPNAEAGAKGLSMAAWAMAALGLAIASTASIVFLEDALQEAVGNQVLAVDFLVAPLAVLVILIAGIGGLVGFTCRHSCVREGFTARKLSRWCLLAILLTAVVAIAMDSHPPVPPAIFGVLWLGLGLVMWCALLDHTKTMMLRMSRADVALFATRLCWGMAVVCCLALVCLVLTAFHTPYSMAASVLGCATITGLFVANAMLFKRVALVLKAARAQAEQLECYALSNIKTTTPSVAEQNFGDAS